MVDPAPAHAQKIRDARLDFFRGLALLVIFISHMPGNWLAWYKPGAFGFSDSADIFVFVSGCAAALAFNRIFRQAGFLAGTARIVKRVAELYACNTGLFFLILALCAAGNRILETGVDYIDLLNLSYFFQHPQEALIGLYTLTYVPNYFDILTMYMVVLAMMPAVMLLARFGPALAGAACLLLYLAVPLFNLNLPAEIAFNRPWFFNPFSWQLLFYTGFFIAAGWVKPPAPRPWLTIAGVVFVIVCIPFSHFATYSRVPWLDAVRTHLEPLVEKTNLGVLRYIHFLCLAYLSVALLNGRAHVLNGRLAAPIVMAGQQALPVFLCGTALSFMGGMALDVFGRGVVATVCVNAAGMAALVGVAALVAWFKSQPWRPKARPQERDRSHANTEADDGRTSAGLAHFTGSGTSPGRATGGAEGAYGRSA
jgi:hypothetical protein